MDIKPITVQELNKYIKQKVDGDEFLNNVYVKGEISNFKLHYTGHMYFTLKDENSLIKCIMFKSYTPHLQFMPKDGMKVVVLGTVSVFERDGVYQIYCKAMKQEGMGTLYEEYQKLKAKLEKEGKTDEYELLEKDVLERAKARQEKFEKIVFKEERENIKKKAGELIYLDLVDTMFDFFVNAFVDKRVSQMNTLTTSLRKISNK